MMKQLGPTPVFPVADTTASAATTYTYGVAAWNSAGTSAMPTVLTNTPACAVSSGQLRWAQQLGGPLSEIGYAVATDSSGNVIVGGTFVGSGTFGNNSFAS